MAGSGRRRLGSSVGGDPLTRVVGADPDLDAVHMRLVDQHARELGQHLGRRLARRERAADAEQRVRLALACLCVARAAALERRELADDDAHEQQQDDAQVLARVGDRERVARVDEQEVVEQERGDGADNRSGSATDDGRGHDRDKVDGGRVGTLSPWRRDEGPPALRCQPDRQETNSGSFRLPTKA